MNNRTVGTLTYTAGGLCLLFFWLLFGDFAISIRERAAVPSVLELLRQHHASDTVMSILLGVLPSILGMFLLYTKLTLQFHVICISVVLLILGKVAILYSSSVAILSPISLIS